MFKNILTVFMYQTKLYRKTMFQHVFNGALNTYNDVLFQDYFSLNNFWLKKKL